MTKASKINRTIIVLATTLNPFKLDPSPYKLFSDNRSRNLRNKQSFNPKGYSDDNIKLNTSFCKIENQGGNEN